MGWIKQWMKRVLLCFGVFGTVGGLTGCAVIGSVSPPPNASHTSAAQSGNLSTGVGVGTTVAGNEVGNQTPAGVSNGGGSGTENVGTNTGTTTGATSGPSSTGQSNGTGTGQGTASATRQNANKGQTSVNGPAQGDFPPVVQMAMGNVDATLRSTGFAPTVNPWDVNGSNQVFYRTWQTLQGPVRNYSVQFSSSIHRLGGFSVSTYDSTNAAAQAFVGQSGLPYSLPGTSTPVQLSTGLAGQVHVFQAQGRNVKQVSSTAVTWQEGRWQIIVSENGDITVPMDTVNQVVSYLSQHFMPVPQSEGAIVVNLQSGVTSSGQPDLNQLNLQMYVTWQEGNRLLQVQTYTHCKNPVDTALAMAISMRPYE